MVPESKEPAFGELSSVTLVNPGWANFPVLVPCCFEALQAAVRLSSSPEFVGGSPRGGIPVCFTSEIFLKEAKRLPMFF